MRRALIAVIIASGACAQTLIDPDHVSTALKEFAPRPGAVPLRCELVPVAPTLDFAFRFRAGYTFRLPVGQYQTAGHAWFVLTKITPRNDDRKPAYLFTRTNAAEIVKTGLNFEVSGSYLLGEGRYAVESILYDDSSRTCKRAWQIDASLTRHERAVQLSLPPFTVRDLPGIRASDWNRPSGAASLTVLLNAAPLSPRRTRLRPADRNLLLSALAAIVGRVPAASVRLVVFSLEAQKELFRSDSFSVDAIGQVARAIDALELSTVDVHILQNPTGHIDLLAGLINQELRAPAPAPTIILLGPLSRFTGRIPEGSLEKRPAASRFFYVQCRPVPRPIIPVDSGADEMPMARGRPAAPGAGAPSGSAGSTGSNSSASTAPAPPPHTGDSSDAGAASSSGGHGGRGGRGAPPPPDPPTGLHDTDVINAAVARLKGRTLVVHTPVDLAKAIGLLQGGLRALRVE
ncbi:MAG: hypothetical protein ABSB88_00070 [Bryobacteraceae bacterium]|jgi:hypothetical protein